MDFPENWVNIQLLIPFKQACWKYHDWGQNIENFHVKALNGIAPLKYDWYQASNPLKICSLHTPNSRRLSLENWLKSDSSLISWMSVISLKSGDFIILVQQTV